MEIKCKFTIQGNCHETLISAERDSAVPWFSLTAPQELILETVKRIAGHHSKYGKGTPLG